MKKSFFSSLKLKITSVVFGSLFSISSSISFADTVNILGLFPFSGPYADSGKLTDQGARIALEEVNYTINGKKSSMLLEIVKLKLVLQLEEHKKQ